MIGLGIFERQQALVMVYGMASPVKCAFRYIYDSARGSYTYAG
jgi:hypothetical protein